MNRGSSDICYKEQLGDVVFNEAPIHESGKCEFVTDSIRQLPSSMRPRFMNRGSRRIEARGGDTYHDLQ